MTIDKLEKAIKQANHIRLTQGVTLRTKQTERWTEEEIEQNDCIERRLVFTNFSSLDKGRARQLIATFENENDAYLYTLLYNSVSDLITKSKLDEQRIWNTGPYRGTTYESILSVAAYVLEANGNESLASAIKEILDSYESSSLQKETTMLTQEEREYHDKYENLDFPLKRLIEECFEETQRMLQSRGIETANDDRAEALIASITKYVITSR